MVTDLPSENGGDGGIGRPSPIVRYGDKFEELCGYYMSLGMSYHDYWDGDNCMTKYYREAEEIKKERRNSELWLQAAYIYEALLDASPVFNPLSKKNKPFPFRSEPIPITSSGSKKSEERKKKQMLENGKEAMRAMMAAFNERFKKSKKGGEADNGS
ncbi:hypothetical protein [Ruthenibacterium lactatiformans]|uniref:hypothetical protein n=1 Tax=Ruthenibacterium lactatiformans TaxID=1550024 RepID=UPI002495A462|nr:hypothetical protein [Ruthenibacterium lactatiformans]